MPDYQITYETRNTYSSRLLEANLDFLVFPEISGNQEILSSSVEYMPSVSKYTSKNLFDFDILRFRLKDFEGEFYFKLQVIVRKEPVNPFGFVSLSKDEENQIIESDGFLVDHFPFLNFTELTRLPGDFQYPVIERDELIFDFVNRMNKYINKGFVFDNNITDPLRKLALTIQQSRGVCQDFTHLMLAILRKNEIPCRYVSGYLNQGEERVGTGAVHAWVQAVIPGIGWIGFDPTNNLLEDHNYIKIAHGIDISDCPTLKGALRGYGTNQTEYRVLVEEQSKKSNQ